MRSSNSDLLGVAQGRGDAPDFRGAVPAIAMQRLRNAAGDGDFGVCNDPAGTYVAD
jgi:hypothetical protein